MDGVGWERLDGEVRGLTAFPGVEGELREVVREMAVDRGSLEVGLRGCDLARCRGMCCHDGVFVGEEEREVIEEVLPGEWFEEREGKWKTRVLGADEGQLGESYPKHFPRTRCVFLDGESRCRLQSLAMAEGQHPWFYKPVPCWLHPLRIGRLPNGRAVLELPGDGAGEEENYREGFASCTSCGKAREDGTPAAVVLRPELEFLGEIGGRDLLLFHAEKEDGFVGEVGIEGSPDVGTSEG
ncbi:MAG: DUF3109 family protein [Verrucomicrobiota bacterium]